MERHIRKLQVTCPSEAEARHGRILLEDAMRTASFGDEGRLVIVRRLELGAISAQANATEWSRRLEARYRSAHPTPVPYDSPAAATAPAVVFPSRHEPWIALALRTAANRTAHEWFWRAAAPGWRPGGTSEATLRSCFRALAHVGGLALTLSLALQLRARSQLTALLRALRAEDLGELRLPLRTMTLPVMLAGVRDDTIPAERSETERMFTRTWGPSDPRTLWLETVSTAAALGLEPGGPHTGGPPALIEEVLLAGMTGAAHAGAARRLSGGRPTASGAMNSTETEASNALPWESERVFTAAGGIFFVLPLLTRAGFAAHLESIEETERRVLPWQFLKLVLRHSRIALDDPLARSLQALPPTTQPLGRWLVEVNRGSLRLTGLKLRQLVSRRAWVTLGPTHVDVHFRPGDADLRIRRAALDVDPGWVPWLGRVIAYHFTQTEP